VHLHAEARIAYAGTAALRSALDCIFAAAAPCCCCGLLAAAVPCTADLWTSVLNFACDLQRHDDAYAAAVANPLPERAAESVKRLVQVGRALVSDA